MSKCVLNNAVVLWQIRHLHSQSVFKSHFRPVVVQAPTHGEVLV